MNCQTELYEQPVFHRKRFSCWISKMKKLRSVCLHVIVLNTIFSPDTHKWIRCGKKKKKKKQQQRQQQRRHFVLKMRVGKLHQLSVKIWWQHYLVFQNEFLYLTCCQINLSSSLVVFVSFFHLVQVGCVEIPCHVSIIN